LGKLVRFQGGKLMIPTQAFNHIMHPQEDPVDDPQANFNLTGKISIQDAIKAALGKKR
jgi:hypothetical protein